MTTREQRLALYNAVCLDCARTTTKAYSTSFSLSIRTLGKDIRDDIYAIYGFVRFADEVVDSFHGHDQRALLERFKEETFLALEEGISTNPIFQAFQTTFHRYSLERLHVEQFLRSMAWDLDKSAYDREHYDEYIVGSAEVVGLMCLKVFVRGDQAAYESLRAPAERLGAAFQKVNFLRDFGEDVHELGRAYFPDLEMGAFNDAAKRTIEAEIQADLDAAVEGIRRLPRDARFGVFLAYTYYRQLLQRIRRVPSSRLQTRRVRVPDTSKAMLLASTWARHKLNLV